MEHDVLIAGASFAGLAAARVLGPAALLLDRAPLGAGQTSACAAPTHLVERMGAGPAIMQRHDHLAIAVGDDAVRWPLPEPFCTFDYAAYCRLAFAGTGAEFRQASVQRIEDARVRTTAGEIDVRMVVDATGPRSTLAGPVRGRRIAFGLETEIAAPPADGLWFHFLPEVRDGYAWAFPCGEVTRFGVLSYLGETKLLPALLRFLQRFDLQPGPLHGGFLATGWRPAATGRVFVAGDAAGQCLPLTGEGIRTAVLAGETCGHLLRGVLDGRWTLEEAGARYGAVIDRERRRYRALLWGNGAALLLPRPALRLLVRTMSRPPALSAFFRHYLSIFAPTT
ncbi:MAG: FAD dependent oxidoreductase [Armatimonadetes bacterium CSP1-3]|nr:MAG: FAD dependent oxidoreductase [Armatimonadetes bacterium CSP1-3]